MYMRSFHKLIKKFSRTVSFGEYECYGPGAETRNRVAYGKQLRQSEAAPYLGTSFIDGQDWLVDVPPQTHHFTHTNTIL